MTAVKPPAYAPTTDAEWARSVNDRLRSLESSSTTRVGDWVIHDADDGTLSAVKPGEDTQVLAGGTGAGTGTAPDSRGNYVTAQQVNDAITAGTSRKNQNDTIIADWLHAVYPVGTITDDATTLVGGKRTWWGAVNDNLLLLSEQLGLAPTTPDPTADVGSATAQNTAQAVRKSQNDTIIADWLHATYPAGSITDTAATLVGGKRTWWGAVNDNLLLLAQQLGLSPTTPDPTADVGAAVVTAQSVATAAGTAAGTAQTAANLAATRLVRKNQNDAIIADWLHQQFPVGTITDTATTLVGGKRTWWGAVNDNLLLLSQQLGLSPTTPDPTADVGGAVVTAQTSIQTAKDAVVAGVIPSTPPGSTDAAVAAAIASLSGSVSDQQSQIIDLQSASSGVTLVLKDTGKDNVVTGLGSNWTASGVNYVSRNATYGFIWGARSGNTARLSRGIYNTPLSTKTQVGTLVLNALMDYWPADFYGGTYYQDGAPENWIILRADTTNPNNFAFARIRYNDVQIGYSLSGTITMVGSPTTFKANTSAGYKFYAGDPSNDYRYTIKSAGATLVTWNDTGHLTSSLIANRYSGQAWKSDNDPGRSLEATPAATSWTAFDASGAGAIPPGYGWLSRLSTTNVTAASGIPPYTFWDNQVALGSGLSLPTSGDSGFIVSEGGVYAFSFTINDPSQTGTIIYKPAIFVNGTVVEQGQNQTYTGGGTYTDLAFGMASAGLLLDPGDMVSPQSPMTKMNGDATGSKSFMKIMKVG